MRLVGTISEVTLKYISNIKLSQHLQELTELAAEWLLFLDLRLCLSVNYRLRPKGDE
jgi:hypothetical protein